MGSGAINTSIKCTTVEAGIFKLLIRVALCGFINVALNFYGYVEEGVYVENCFVKRVNFWSYHINGVFFVCVSKLSYVCTFEDFIF